MAACLRQKKKQEKEQKKALFFWRPKGRQKKTKFFFKLFRSFFDARPSKIVGAIQKDKKTKCERSGEHFVFLLFCAPRVRVEMRRARRFAISLTFAEPNSFFSPKR
jgi:hypothetical protein